MQLRRRPLCAVPIGAADDAAAGVHEFVQDRRHCCADRRRAQAAGLKPPWGSRTRAPTALLATDSAAAMLMPRSDVLADEAERPHRVSAEWQLSAVVQAIGGGEYCSAAVLSL